MIIKNYNFNITEISDIATDTYLDHHLWIAYKQDTDGICLLRKVSANDPNQTYFDVEITTNEINKIFCDNTLYLYLALNDNTYFGKRYNVTNPFSFVTNISKPVGVAEAPIDIVKMGSYMYFLTPGNISGTNAKIIKFNTSGVYQSTIDLTTVQNAISFCVVGTEFWVVTYSYPASYVRVYDTGGGVYGYTVNY